VIEAGAGRADLSERAKETGLKVVERRSSLDRSERKQALVWAHPTNIIEKDIPSKHRKLDLWLLKKGKTREKRKKSKVGNRAKARKTTKRSTTNMKTYTEADDLLRHAGNDKN
jgi:hypothetical protein